MTDFDWVAAGSAVAAVLSLIGTMISAAGAARSADVAKQAEERAQAADAASTQRELKRTSASGIAESQALIELADRCTGQRRALSAMMGHSGGNVERDAIERYDGWRTQAQSALHLCNPLPTEPSEFQDRQIAIDAALVNVRAAKEAALLDMQEMQRARAGCRSSHRNARLMVTIPAPMHAPEALRAPLTDPEWLYELKFDGYRCMAGIERDDGFEIGEDVAAMAARVQLRTKRGADCTTWFPKTMKALASLPGGPHVVDGEVCVLRPDGTSDFNLLQPNAWRRYAAKYRELEWSFRASRAIKAP